MGFFVIALSVVAGECRYCGSDTDEINVYRCTQCRKFFCDKCRGGEKNSRTGNAMMDHFSALGNMMQCRIVCPECGAEDTKELNNMKRGVIKIVR